MTVGACPASERRGLAGYGTGHRSVIPASQVARRPARDLGAPAQPLPAPCTGWEQRRAYSLLGRVRRRGVGQQEGGDRGAGRDEGRLEDDGDAQKGGGALLLPQLPRIRQAEGAAGYGASFGTPGRRN